MKARAWFRPSTSVFVLVATLLGPLAASGGDSWQIFRPLVGRWQGEGSGFGVESDVIHEWEFVLQSKFLRLQTESVARTENRDRHEDTGYLSQDTELGAFTFRSFLSEGFVNTYDVIFEAEKSPTIRFDHREAENAGGMRARMHLTFHSPDEYEMVLELAGPGGDFAPCQQMRMKRVP